MSTTTTADNWCHETRKQIDAIIQNVALAKPNFTKGAREVSLAYTKLQEAKMWIGKVLEELGSPFPPELADKADMGNKSQPA